MFKKLLSLVLSVALVCGVGSTMTSYSVDPAIIVEVNSDSGYLEAFEDGIYYALYSDHAEVLDIDPYTNNVIVPDSVRGVPVTAIAENIFFKTYHHITSFQLPNTIQTLSEGYFNFFPDLEEILVFPDNPYYSSLDGVLYSRDMTKLIRFPKNKSGSYFTVPAFVEEIGTEAFYHTKIEDIKLPDGLIRINDMAFRGCDSLTEIELPKSLERIGRCAFMDTNLTSIEIPENVRLVDSDAFSGIISTRSIPKEIIVRSPYCYFEQSIELNDNTSICIKGYDDSTAYEYALSNGLTFESLGDKPVYLRNNFLKEGDITYALYSDHSEVVYCDKNAVGDIVILDSIDVFPVTEIKNYAFLHCANITSIHVSNTVEMIGEGAFGQCYSLKEINIPYGITEIKDNSFSACRALKEISFPDTIKRIAQYAFNDCRVLTSVDIPNSVRTIGDRAFGDCLKLESALIPENVINVSHFAFSGTPWLEKKKNEGPFVIINGVLVDATANPSDNITVPDGVRRIGGYAFYKNNTVKNVIIPETVWYIEDYALMSCADLDSLTILNPNCKMDFGKGTSKGSLTISNSGDSWGEYSGVIRGYFDSIAQKYAEAYDRTFIALDEPEVTNLSTTTVSTTITNTATTTSTDNNRIRGTCGQNITWTLSEDLVLEIIGDGAMDDWKGYYEVPWKDYRDQIVSVNIGSGITHIGAYAFHAAHNLKEVDIPNTVKSIGNSAFASSGLSSVNLPDSITEIGNSAFSATSLVGVFIPSSVVSIGADAFTANQFLKTIQVSAGNLYYTSKDGILFSKDMKTLITCPCRFQMKEYIVPDTVTAISGRAFSLCSSMTSIVLSDNVTEIGEGAFRECKSLTTMVIPKDITRIERSTFEGCSNLDSVVLPDRLDCIGESTFLRCEALKNIDLPSGIMTLERQCFIESGINQIMIPASVTKIGDSVFSGCSSLESITLEEGNNNYISIDGVLFSADMKTLVSFPPGKPSETYEIPQGVLKIERGAFWESNNLVTVLLPESVSSIGIYAFLKCNNLSHIYIPEKTVSISNDAFNGCEKVSIYGKNGTYAQSFAETNNITFQTSDLFPLEIPINTTTATASISSTTTTTTTQTTTATTTILTTTTTSATTPTTTTFVTTTSSTVSTIATTTTYTTTTVTTIIHFNRDADSWSFTNNGPNFREDGKLVLLDSEIEKIENIKKLYNKHTMNAIIDEFINNPGGACYGMTLLDLIYLSDRDHYLPLIQEGATELNSVKLDAVRSKINYYSLTQILPEIQYEIADPENGNDTVKIKRLLDLLENGPVLVCYQARSDKKGSVYSHAVLAYEVEAYKPVEGEDEEFLKSLNYEYGSDTMKVIKVYDPQYSSYSDKCNIYINQTRIAGKDVILWNIRESYKYNDLSTKNIMLVSNDLSILNKYGLFEDFNGSEPDLTRVVQPKFTVSSRETSNGPLKYKIDIGYDNFTWIGSSINEECPYYVASDFYGDSSDINTNKYYLKYPKEAYTFDYEDEQSTYTTIRTQYPDSLFDLEAEKLKSVSFDEEKISFILDNNSKFSLRMISDKQSDKTDFYTVNIDGTASGRIECSYDGKGTWWVTSDAPLKKINVHASNDSDCFNQNVSNYSATSKVITIKYKKTSSLDKISIGNEDEGTQTPKNEFGDINAIKSMLTGRTSIYGYDKKKRKLLSDQSFLRI